MNGKEIHKGLMRIVDGTEPTWRVYEVQLKVLIDIAVRQKNLRNLNQQEIEVVKDMELMRKRVLSGGE